MTSPTSSGPVLVVASDPDTTSVSGDVAANSVRIESTMTHSAVRAVPDARNVTGRLSTVRQVAPWANDVVSYSTSIDDVDVVWPGVNTAAVSARVATSSIAVVELELYPRA